MSRGSEHLALITARFSQDPLATGLGIVLDELTGNTVKMHMKLEPRHNNYYGRPHGAAMYALADAAFSVIGNNNNEMSVALDCSITYHASPDPGEVLHVEGHEIAGSRKIGCYLFTLYTDAGGARRVVATMKSTLYKTGKPIDPTLAGNGK